MRKRLAATTVVLAMTLVSVLGTAWAQARVTVTREESKPQKVEVKVGEEVRWVNSTGGTAHVAFAGADGISFYIGKEGRVKFDKPGTYDYTVHISGVKGHAHTGTISSNSGSRTAEGRPASCGPPSREERTRSVAPGFTGLDEDAGEGDRCTVNAVGRSTALRRE